MEEIEALAIILLILAIGAALGIGFLLAPVVTAIALGAFIGGAVFASWLLSA